MKINCHACTVNTSPLASTPVLWPQQFKLREQRRKLRIITKAGRQILRQTVTQAGRQLLRQADSYYDRQTAIQAGRQLFRQADSYSGRHAGRQLLS